MSLSVVQKFPKVHKGNLTSFLNFLGNFQPLGYDDMSFATDELDFIAVATAEDYTPVETMIEKLATLTGLGNFAVRKIRQIAQTSHTKFDIAQFFAGKVCLVQSRMLVFN